MMNEWRKLHLLFHVSKNTLKDLDMQIRAFESLIPKLKQFFSNDQHVSANMLACFSRTYENHIRRDIQQQNRKFEIKNRVGVYLLLLARQGLSCTKFWKSSTLDEIMRSFMNLLDMPLFEDIFAPIIYTENSCFYKFIDDLVKIEPILFCTLLESHYS